MRAPGVMGRVVTKAMEAALEAMNYTGERAGGLLLIGPTGSLKTATAQVLIERSGWIMSIPQMLSGRWGENGYTRDEMMALLQQLHVVPTPPRACDHEFYVERFARLVPGGVNPSRYRADKDWIGDWVHEYLGVQRWPEDETARALVQLGFPEFAGKAPAYPIYIRARSEASRSFLRSQFLENIHPGPRPPRTFDAERIVMETARRFRLLLLVDEADILDEPALTLCREWKDICGLGLVLIGTEVLLGALKRHRTLEPLADRMNFGVVTMARPTLADLSECLPQFSSDIVQRIWQRAGTSFRVAESIALGIQDALEKRSGARVTRTLVDRIADTLPTSVHQKVVARVDEQPEGESVEHRMVGLKSLAGAVDAPAPVRASAKSIFRKRAAAR